MAKHKRPGRAKDSELNSGDRDRQEDSGVSRSEVERPKADKNSIKLDKWQEEVKEYDGDFLLCTGRRVGKTQIMAIKAVEEMVRKPTQIIVASLTEDQAQLIIIMALIHLEQNYKSWIKKPYSRNIQKGSITLNNGSRILARPVGNTGDAIRGFNADILILDEVSRFNELILLAATPILLTTGGKIWMCSTPFGKKGFFWEQFNQAYNLKDPDARFKVFYQSSEQVVYDRPISHSWTEDTREKAIRFLEQEKKTKTKLQYGQEYMGLFMEDLNQLYSDELIQRQSTLSRNRGFSSFSPSRDYFLGVDLARMGGDLISYQIIQRINKDVFYHVESINEQYKLTTETYDKIIGLNKLWNFREIGIDAGSGSLGVGVSDFLMREPSIRKKIVDLNNRQVIIDYKNDKTGKLLKEMMYFHMLMLMEQGKLYFLDDDDVRLSLKSIQYEYIIKDGQKTKIKIFGSGGKKIDHICEGLVRAVHLANQKHLNLKITWI